MRRILKLLFAALTLAGVATLSLVYWPINSDRPPIELSGNVERGAYMARMAGCIGCHTNTEKGGAALAGGVPLKTKFGTFYSPNLTTDKVFGIGGWTLNEFSNAVRNGVSRTGEPYYPAFPYPFYSKLSEQDIADLWAAFKTVPPVAETSRPLDLMFPFNFRPGVKLWQYAYLDSESFVPVPSKSKSWNRGKYIVEGPAHCGACHTPRNYFGARKVELSMLGADKLPNGGKSPAITRAKLLAGGWTVKNLKFALKTGILPNGDAFGGSMGEVVREGTSFLSDEDLTAIADYLIDSK